MNMKTNTDSSSTKRKHHMVEDKLKKEQGEDMQMYTVIFFMAAMSTGSEPPSLPPDYRLTSESWQGRG